MHGDRPIIDRSLPASEGSEKLILGGILLDNDKMQAAAETLAPDDFYSPMYRRVFRAMLDLFKRESTITPILIGEELKKDGDIESIGGVAAITNLTYGLPFLLGIDEYLKVVRQKSELRQLMRACSEIMTHAADEETEPSEIFSSAQKKINDLCLLAESGSSEEYFVPLSRVIDNDVIQALENLRYGKNTKIKTHFPAIDTAIGGGISPSDVLLVAADTGSGKSAFALQLAYQIAASGTPTAFLAGEMQNSENVMRLLSQLSGITNLNWLTHINETEYQNLVEWAIAIREAPIRFDHRISDLSTLRTHLRTIVRRHKVKVLVIDYIQLFKLEKADKRKRHERISEASQEVKRLANEMGIAIVEVAQFNREGAKSMQAGLHDLEGSGQLEKDASLIFILELGDHDLIDTDGRKYRESKIRIVKGRNVGRGQVEGKFFGRSVQFDFSQMQI